MKKIVSYCIEKDADDYVFTFLGGNSQSIYRATKFFTSLFDSAKLAIEELRQYHFAQVLRIVGYNNNMMDFKDFLSMFFSRLKMEMDSTTSDYDFQQVTYKELLS